MVRDVLPAKQIVTAILIMVVLRVCLVIRMIRVIATVCSAQLQLTQSMWDVNNAVIKSNKLHLYAQVALAYQIRF